MTPVCIDCAGKRRPVVQSYMRPMCLVCALRSIQRQAGVEVTFIDVGDIPVPRSPVTAQKEPA
jgi:hypothetical protein